LTMMPWLFKSNWHFSDGSTPKNIQHLERIWRGA
jgi:hypothetical protein